MPLLSKVKKRIAIFACLCLVYNFSTMPASFAAESDQDLSERLKSLEEIIKEEKTQLKSLKEELIKLDEEKKLLQEKLTECAQKKVSAPDAKTISECEKQYKNFLSEIKDITLEKEKKVFASGLKEKELDILILQDKLKEHIHSEKEILKNLKEIKETKKMPAKKQKPKKLPAKLNSDEYKREVRSLLEKIDEKNKEIAYLKGIIDKTVRRLEGLSLAPQNR